MDTKRIEEYLKEEIEEKKKYLITFGSGLPPRVIVKELRSIQAYRNMLKDM